MVPKSLFFETVTDFSVINAEKLGSAGGHVDIVRFAFGALLVQELVDRIVSRFQLDQDVHNDKECLTQIRGSAFGTLVGFLDLVT